MSEADGGSVPGWVISTGSEADCFDSSQCS